MKKPFNVLSTLTASTLTLCLAGSLHAAEITTDEQIFSYGIGMQIGQSLTRQDFEVDQEALMLAIEDALNGKKPRITPEELKRVMEAEEKKIADQQSSAGAANQKIGTEYLAENAKKDGVKVTDSGIQYRVLNEGSGAKPTASDTVTVHYRGTLINGTEFDSSYARGEPASFPVSGVIKGWIEILPMMREGDKWEVTIPSELAYGERGAGKSIGPNETLIFEIELLQVVK